MAVAASPVSNQSPHANQSIYLLGEGNASLLKRYQNLKETLASQGEFLSATDSPEWLACYDRDSQHLHTRLPLLVFRPYTTFAIAPFIQACGQSGIPVKTRCGGTSFTGASVASQEGVILLTGHLKEISSYQPQNGRVIVEPGVTPNQLNEWVKGDGWWFPLEMTSSGVAGLAGCLSCHAKGYHQRGRSLLPCIRSVILVDGQGEMLTVPPQLVCGTEGLFGVIIQIELQLMRRPSSRVRASCPLSWQDMLNHLPVLRDFQAIAGLVWQNSQFLLDLEGDDWRIAPALNYLSNLCEIKVLTSGLSSFYPQSPNKHACFILISSACLPAVIDKGLQAAEDFSKNLGLECQSWADVWTGAIHLHLSSLDDRHLFTKKMEKFFLLWIDWLEEVQGFLVSSHGIGKLLRPYLPPFWKEEDILFLKQLQQTFDPFGLFERDHFFPGKGKSVERVCDDRL